MPGDERVALCQDVDMDAPTTAAPPFGVEVLLRWGDMDAFGHVNNVVFHRLLEEARIRAFTRWFEGWAGESSPRMTVLLARQEVEFLGQLHYRPEPVHIDLWVTDIGGASWDLGYEMRETSEPDSTLYLRAESTQVAFDPERQAPRSLTGDERAVLGAHRGDPVPLRRRRR